MSDNKLIGVIDSTQTLSGFINGKSEINVTVTSVGSIVKTYIDKNIHSDSIIGDDNLCANVNTATSKVHSTNAIADVEMTALDTVTVKFASAPASG